MVTVWRFHAYVLFFMLLFSWLLLMLPPLIANVLFHFVDHCLSPTQFTPPCPKMMSFTRANKYCRNSLIHRTLHQAMYERDRCVLEGPVESAVNMMPLSD
jgi:hypothetical protein